jgi:integrase
MQANRRRVEGVEEHHSRACASRRDGRCNCTPRYRGIVWSARDRKLIRGPWLIELTAAKTWRDDARSAVRKGTMRAPTPVTLREAAEQWLAGARAGAIRTRSGDRYKPSTIASYEEALRLRVLPELGGARLSEVRRADLQELVDQLQADGLKPSTIRNTLMPVRAIYRRAERRDQVAVNPTTRLELPAVRGRRERIASPSEASQLLAALPAGDRALWATAMYAGLRRGELRALAWDDVDLAANVIRVERSWDTRPGAEVDEPKSRAGRRTVPIPSLLRTELLEHGLRSGRREGLVFGRAATEPFDPSTVLARARRAWAAAKLEPIGLHECRHTFASLAIAARVNAKALCTYMGHAGVAITYDRYGHLMPGNEHEAAGLLDSYLARASAARLPGLE